MTPERLRDVTIREHPRDRIGELVHDARVSLGMSVSAACEAARRVRPDQAVGPGISKTTWERIEKGMSVRPSAWADVERLFDWPPGSIRRYVEDNGPEPAKPAQEAPVVEERQTDAGRAFIARVGPLSDAEAAVLESVLDGLRKRNI